MKLPKILYSNPHWVLMRLTPEGIPETYQYGGAYGPFTANTEIFDSFNAANKYAERDGAEVIKVNVVITRE